MLSPLPFKTPLSQTSGLVMDAECLDHRQPRVCPERTGCLRAGDEQPFFFLSPHCPDDSPGSLRCLQSKYQLHNFLVEKVIALLENADRGRWPLEMRASR